MCNQAWQERYRARIEILRMITSFRHHWYVVRPGGQRAHGKLFSEITFTMQ